MPPTRKPAKTEIQTREDKEWDALERRVIFLVYRLLCLFALANEFFLRDGGALPHHLVFIATALGVPSVVNALRGGQS